MNFQLKMEPIKDISYWIAAWATESGNVWSNNRKWSLPSDPLMFDVEIPGFLNVYWIEGGNQRMLLRVDLQPKDGATYVFNPVTKEVTSGGGKGGFPWLLVGGLGLGALALAKIKRK